MKRQVKMTNMTDKKLDMALNAYDAPQPSELLKARILKAAKPRRKTQVKRFLLPMRNRLLSNAIWRLQLVC